MLQTSHLIAAGVLLLISLARHAPAQPIDDELDTLELDAAQSRFAPNTRYERASLAAPPEVELASAHRFRRQLAYPQLPPPQQQQQQLPGPMGVLDLLSGLSAGSQQAQQGPSLADGARVVSMLSQALSGQQQQQQQPPQQQQQPGQMSPANLAGGIQLMSQLSQLMRSTQERSAKAAADAQQSVQAAGQQTLQAAQGTQGGFQSALSDLGAGLQRITMNNPNLVPDVKSLYQQVSSRLSSATNSINPSSSSSSSLNGPIVPATNAEQFADNLAKVALQPQPNV